MYENNEEIFFEETDEAGGSALGVRDIHDIDSGYEYTSVSAGDAGDIAVVPDGFNYNEFVAALSNALGGSVSGGDSDGSMSVVQEDVFEILQEINISVQGLYSLVTLIFVYLLLDWTSRKLLAVVNRFTGRRR